MWAEIALICRDACYQDILSIVCIHERVGKIRDNPETGSIHRHPFRIDIERGAGEHLRTHHFLIEDDGFARAW